ncbi:MAG TPA: SDR family oxidoreductase [Bacteroidales bacterium]|nr:SDR family oxidoreductase [Bacteroidales bacterium]
MISLGLKDKVAIVTGGYGAICSEMVMCLAGNGVKTAILGRDEKKAADLAKETENKTGTICIGIAGDVLDRKSLERARARINGTLGPVDILINGAGGNSPKATTVAEHAAAGNDYRPGETFFGLDPSGFDEVFDLNLKGTILPTLVFATDMTERGSGSIINISSMNSFRPLTRIPAYSAAKAAINNFTQWLAVHFAPRGVRVNAIAPGFIITDQNRFLLTEKESGNLTARGRKVISNTPMGKFGTAEEMTGTVLYLASGLSGFVTGVVIPVDGGFNAYSGV